MKDMIDISIILDKSGSMESIKNDILGGLKTFVEEQKKNTKPCNISLFAFDTAYSVIFENQDVKLIEIKDSYLIPYGGTALYDAIGKTIDRVGARLRDLNESDRPNKVLVMIYSDGEENASKEYIPKLGLNNLNLSRHFTQKSSQVVSDMIKHQTEKYNWQFMFCGCNQDAVLTGKNLGIPQENSVTFNTNSRSIYNLAHAMSAKVSEYNSTGDKGSLVYSALDKSAIDVK